MRQRIAVALGLAAVASVVALSALGGSDARQTGPTRAAGPARPSGAPGTNAKFASLVTQTSNRCDLQAQEIMRYGPQQRLQGSCCSKMDATAYGRQVRYVHRYAADSNIPTDPYDVSAALVQRLLRYDRDIQLNAVGLATYRQAIDMSPEKGPCCCACWRATAFRGLSKQLIVNERWPAPRVARLIGALDGCGGGTHQVRARNRAPV